MQFEQAVRSRHSFRAFLPNPVPPGVLREVFDLASQAPSNCNLQPWHVHVASGRSCDGLREQLKAAALANPSGNPDFEWTGKFGGEYKQRQLESAVALWKCQGVERDDKGRRVWSWMRNFEFFGAPHVAFVFFSGELSGQLRLAGDVGMYAQTLMLALRNAGVGSCPQTSLSFYPDVVREALGVEPRFKLLMGISFGYIDPSDPANELRTSRAPLDQTTRFHD